MLRFLRRALLWITGILLMLTIATLCVMRFILLPNYDGEHNRVLNPAPYVVPDSVRVFHDNSFVADLHADPLLWGRDLSTRYQRGHIDLPRLREGGVDLQVFGAVTSFPTQIKLGGKAYKIDALSLLFLGAWRSPESWFSPKARALVQAQDIRSLEESGEISLVKSRSDLNRPGLKGLLAIEGLHALEGDIEVIDELHAAGYRMMGFAHLFDNDVSGSSFGRTRYGLTPLGRRLIPRMEQLGITIDFAHTSSNAFNEAMAIVTKPVVVSHGGVARTCPGPRNLSDAQLRAVAKNGGVVGIGYWKVAVCDPGLNGIVRAIRHAVNVAGVDHVGLGSDFDGTVAVPFDTTGVPLVTGALLDAGFSETEVRKILGENVRRVLSANLPQ